MTFPTYEQYDENEYFIKFKAIHPCLIYSKDVYNFQKKEFQLRLLNKLNANEITYDQLKEKYSELMKQENEKNNYIENLKDYYKICVDTENKSLEYSILQFMGEE